MRACRLATDDGPQPGRYPIATGLQHVPGILVSGVQRRMPEAEAMDPVVVVAIVLVCTLGLVVIR